jgi:hypothetical protein
MKGWENDHRREIRPSPFHLELEWKLSISNDEPEFKVGAFNGVYEVNVNMSFKNLNHVKSCK